MMKKWLGLAAAMLLVGGGATVTVVNMAHAQTNSVATANQEQNDGDQEVADDQGQQDQEVSDAQEQADLAKQAKITEQQSHELAVKKVDGTVLSSHLEDEDGNAVYNVLVQDSKGVKQEVKVDAKSGAVTKVEAADQETNDGGEQK